VLYRLQVSVARAESARPVAMGAAGRLQGGRRWLLAELGVCLQRRTVTGPFLLGEEGDFPVSVCPQGVGTAHRTLPLEHDPLVDHEARSRDVAEELAGGADLEALARRDVA